MPGVLQSRWITLLAGSLVGAAAGLLVYHSIRLTGRPLYIVAGAAAGAIAAAIAQSFTRSVRLTDVTVSIPQFSELRFAVTRNSQQVAWKMFVESATRVSTQGLTSDSGSVREALTSLYGLFATLRETLKEGMPSQPAAKSPTVEHLAIAMLNNELRPFLSRWHPRLRRWEDAHPGGDEAAWPDNGRCRQELADVQGRLAAYVLAFGKLAGLAEEYATSILRGQLAAGFAARVPVQSPASVNDRVA